MKRVLSTIFLSLFVFLLTGCSSISKDEIMAAHLESGSSIDLDPSMYTFYETLDASFGSIDTTTEVNIISIYLYEYTPMDITSNYTRAYIVVEDKYALKNGVSLSVDASKYIIIYSDTSSTASANESLLIENAELIFNDHRVATGLEVPTFDLNELILSRIN